MLSKQSKSRLTKLIEFMESLPQEARQHFSMTDWYSHKGCEAEHGFYSKRSLSMKDLENCGTAACALGWAAVNPSFKRLGLNGRSSGGVTFNGHVGIAAAQAFFGIDYSLAEELFSGRLSCLRTPKQWARHARRMLRQRGV